jgi:DNA primase small subunit
MPGADDTTQYYRNFFPHETACALLGRAWRGSSQLHLRELCVETKDAAYIRWQSVSSPEELKQLFINKNAEKFHVGAVFDQQPCHKRKLRCIVPTARELVFDIDVNDYSTWGVDSGDIASCDAAWHIVAFGMIVVRHIMEKHFGFKNTILVYSGRRGAHLSVHDARACELTDDARAAIVAFVSPPDKPGPTGRTNFCNMMSLGFFGEMYDTHILPFWENMGVRPRQDGGLGALDTPQDKEYFLELMGDNYAQKTLCLNALNAADTWNAIKKYAANSRYRESTERALRETVLTYVWPKLDAAVSKHRNHLNKAWFSVHPKTGRICVPVFGDPSRFNPAECPTVSGLMAGSKQQQAVFYKAVADFRKFVDRLSKSPSERWVPPRVKLPELPVYSMVGSKRTREVEDLPTDPLDDQYMFTDRSRLCWNVNRVFFAVASSSEPSKVCIYWYTSLCTEFTKDSVNTVYPGYSPPFRAKQSFPVAEFVKAVERASTMPESEVSICSAYTCVLLHPRNVDKLKSVDRLDRMRERLIDPNFLCVVNSSWGEDAIASVVSQMAQPVWEVAHLYMN